MVTKKDTPRALYLASLPEEQITEINNLREAQSRLKLRDQNWRDAVVLSMFQDPAVRTKMGKKLESVSEEPTNKDKSRLSNKISNAMSGMLRDAWWRIHILKHMLIIEERIKEGYKKVKASAGLSEPAEA